MYVGAWSCYYSGFCGLYVEENNFISLCDNCADHCFVKTYIIIIINIIMIIAISLSVTFLI